MSIDLHALVRIRSLENDRRNLLYAGWWGVVVEATRGADRSRYLVDSDEAVRRTGKMQAVSFTAWFDEDELEVIARAEGETGGTDGH